MAFHHPQPGVNEIVFDPSAFSGPIMVHATSSGVAGGVVTDASAFVRHADQNGCEIVTVVFDRETDTLITQNADFCFTIIEYGAGFRTPAT